MIPIPNEKNQLKKQNTNHINAHMMAHGEQN